MLFLRKEDITNEIICERILSIINFSCLVFKHSCLIFDMMLMLYICVLKK